jgi:hypothetical protein
MLVCGDIIRKVYADDFDVLSIWLDDEGEELFKRHANRFENVQVLENEWKTELVQGGRHPDTNDQSVISHPAAKVSYGFKNLRRQIKLTAADNIATWNLKGKK